LALVLGAVAAAAGSISNLLRGGLVTLYEAISMGLWDMMEVKRTGLDG
jgi:hypothetical protein